MEASVNNQPRLEEQPGNSNLGGGNPKYSAKFYNSKFIFSVYQIMFGKNSLNANI